jgi:hypothetical protein
MDTTRRVWVATALYLGPRLLHLSRSQVLSTARRFVWVPNTADALSSCVYMGKRATGVADYDRLPGPFTMMGS